MMDIKSARRRRFPLRSVVTMTAVLALVLTPGIVLAFSGFGTDWETAHPGSTSFTNASCELCHSASTKSNWNAYGNAVRAEYFANGQDMPGAIATVDALNSDGDPTAKSNAAEALANTQPGWRYGPNNTIYNANGGVVSSGQLPPSSITGLLDPVSLVSISDTAFTPASVAPKVGGVVQWIRGSGTISHNVAEVGNIFTSGTPTTAAIWYNRIVSAGTFTYHDDAHLALVGTIKVKPTVTATPTGVPFTVTWATTKTNTGTKFNVQYQIGTGAWVNWYTNTTLKKAVFGASGLPIVPVAGTTYGFRIQSGTGTVWSGYSPLKTYVPTA
jgi:hypothetical protein